MGIRHASAGTARRLVVGLVLSSLLGLTSAGCAREPVNGEGHGSSSLRPVPPSELSLPAPPPPDLPLAAALEGITTTGPLAGRDEERRELFRGHLSTLAALGPRTRPELFPTPEHVLAYLVNAHLAWTLALGNAPEFAGLTPGALREVPITVDGRTTTLRGLAEDVRARAPFEPRLALFLNPGWRGVPPLPETPLSGTSFAWQLTHQAERTGRTPGFWQLDAEAKVLKVSSFADYIWGLPGEQPARMHRLFDLIPPPATLRSRILAACGASLSACTPAALPIDDARLWPR